MTSKLTVMCLSILLVVPGLAQGKAEKKTGRRSGPPGAQRIEVSKSERFARGINGLLARVMQKMDLDEDQKVKVNAIADEFRERYVDEKNRSKSTLETMDKLKEAREAGDKELVQKLRAKLRNLRGSNLTDQFCEAIRPIMREDQLEELDRMQYPIQPARQITKNPATKLLRIRDELGLSPEQNKMFNRALAKYRKPKSSSEPDAEILSLVAELQEAVAAGDEDRIAEIRERVAEKSRTSDKTEKLYAELASFLDDEQMEHVERVRDSLKTHDSRDSRAILRAVRRLRLDRGQRDKLREIETYARNQMRTARRDDQARAELDETVDKQVREILTPLQIKQLDKILEKTKSRGSRTARPARPKPPEKAPPAETEDEKGEVEEDKP